MADSTRIFELRTYTAAPGKFDALVQRFRKHTIELFRRHGIDPVAFFLPIEPDGTLVYILGFESEQSAQRSWETFLADPDSINAKAESERDGVLVANQDIRKLTTAEFSDLR